MDVTIGISRELSWIESE